MRKIMIHFGAPKCASSSIQKLLTRNPSLGFSDKENGAKLQYWVLNSFGANRALSEDYLSGNQEYFSSHDFFWPSDDSKTCIHQLLLPLIVNPDSAPKIISCEDYGRLLKYHAYKIVYDCKCDLSSIVELHGVFFTRDLISLIQSSWLQWGIWSRYSLEDWIIESFDSNITNHGEIVENISKLGLTKFHVGHIHSTSPINFLTNAIENMGLQCNEKAKPEDQITNPTLSLEAYRLLFNDYQVRKMHDSRAEVVLQKLIARIRYRTTSIGDLIGKNVFPLIYDKYTSDRELLSQYLQTTSSERIIEELEYIEREAEIARANLDISKSEDLFDYFMQNNSIEFLNEIVSQLLQELMTVNEHSAENAKLRLELFELKKRIYNTED